MGQTRGIEPPNTGTTIQCLNLLATPAMALRHNRAENSYINMAILMVGVRGFRRFTKGFAVRPVAFLWRERTEAVGAIIGLGSPVAHFIRTWCFFRACN